ncbi:MAG TPA: NAD(P)H-dependent oxidoreductase [Nakamurella sp.]|nr:NAD(P)H-dependent oxidoreductase [Nakamurella sp.]
MTKIAIILGSTRHGRNGAAVARWFYELAVRRTDAEFELVDQLDDELPLLDETWPPSLGMYQHAHTKRWAAKVAEFDGYVFVTAEYNLGIRGALKNAIDFVYAERNNKVAGFVSYGQAGGVHAVDHLRLVAAELQVATVRAQVSLSLITDFENYSVFKPGPQHEQSVVALLDQLISWSRALETVRAAQHETPILGHAVT